VTRPWTTPAQGPFSPVGVLIDADENGLFDYAVFAEPYSASQPYLDVLVSQLHDAKGNAIGERRFLDLVPASGGDTAPFFNNVLVMSIFAKDIGLGAGKTHFKYAAFGNRIDTPFFDEVSKWSSFDLAKRPLDTAVLAPKPGLPLYAGNAPVRVRVDADAAGPEGLPKLLLLHHDNVEAARWEVVDLAAPRAEALQIDLDTAAAAPGRVVRTITLTNAGGAALADIVISGSVSGAEIAFAAPSQGSCQPGALSCAIGVIAPGQAATILLGLDAGEAPISVTVKAQTSNGCISSKGDAIAVIMPGRPDALHAAGGCGCRLGPAARDVDQLWLALVVALAAFRRAKSAKCLRGNA